MRRLKIEACAGLRAAMLPHDEWMHVLQLRELESTSILRVRVFDRDHICIELEISTPFRPSSCSSRTPRH